MSLRFSGDARLNIAFAEMRDVNARGGVLRFHTPDGPVALDLGDAAEAWARAILNPKSRIDKLGVKPGMRVCLLGVSDATFRAELEKQLGAPVASAARGTYDIIFRELRSARDLADLDRFRARLALNGALWLIYAKGKGAALSEREVRAAFLATGLVDTKVVAFSPTHTAVKLVIPRAERGRP
jgi:hypothetical protein